MLIPGLNPAWNPATSPLGEEPEHPEVRTSTGGGTTTKRLLHCLSCDVWNWYLYFTSENPLCPYSLNAVAVDFHQRPFEKQERIAGLIDTYGPGYANYEWSLLEVAYESQGMEYFPGQGTVKEEQRPRIENVPIGVMRGFMPQTDSTDLRTLQWSVDDGGSSPTKAMYYGEHPHCEVGSREIILTFPFAPTASDLPWGEGSVNSDTFQLPVTGDICPPWTLKYMGVAKETSVVIPCVGIYTGLKRTRKSFIFHYLNANIGNAVPNSTPAPLTWNQYFRARDQETNTLTDMNGNAYLQFTPVSFSSVNWFA